VEVEDQLPVCQSTREETNSVGLDQGRNEKLCVAQAGVGRTQFEFTEWTPDGHLSHSKFVGLREDKEVREDMDYYSPALKS
jgi:hypothetical protein